MQQGLSKTQTSYASQCIANNLTPYYNLAVDYMHQLVNNYDTACATYVRYTFDLILCVLKII